MKQTRQTTKSLVFLACVSLLIGAAANAQSPEHASVAGIVVRDGTNDPVPRARVTLAKLETEEAPLTVTTDDSGRFAFSSVPPGPYALLALHDGYVKASYGQVDNFFGGPVVMLEPRQTLKNVVVSMTPTVVISGRIRNSFGEPLGNVIVQAQRHGYRAGGRVLEPVLTVMTNDLGEYRLYFLKPGPYIVSAIPAAGPIAGTDGRVSVGNLLDLPGGPFAGVKSPAAASTAATLAALGVVSASDTGETYLPVYFPGVTDPSAAKVMDLPPGGSFDAADFVLASVRAVRIQGKITIGATGQPPRGASVFLMSESNGANYLQKQPGVVSASGTFEFRGVAPGSYDLVATLGDLPTGLRFGAGGVSIGLPKPPPPSSSATPRLIAKTRVQVGGDDLTGITLTLDQGYRFNGRISVEGLPQAESESLMKELVVQLQPDPRTFDTAPPPAFIDSNGAFSVTGVVAGRYAIEIQGCCGARWKDYPYLKSVQLGNVDGLNPRLVIDGEPRGELEIVMGTVRGTFEAAVVDEKLAPVVGARVILIPDIPRRQRYDLYKVWETDESGMLAAGVIPGEYMAVALKQVEEGAWWDPAFAQKYQGRGQSIRIDASRQMSVQLKLIP